MTRNRRLASIPLIIVGIAFINIAIATDRRAFIGIGIVFIIVGIALLIRRRGVKTSRGESPTT